MTKTKLILSIAAVPCLLISLRVLSQEPGDRTGFRPRESRLQIIEAEIDLKMHELELRMSELTVDEATVEYEKFKMQLEAAKEAGDSRELRHAELELKQAAIRIDMGKVQIEMARVKLECAKARLEHKRVTSTEEPGIPTPVQLEYVDGLDVVIIRGAKPQVERIKALIEDLEKKAKKERE